MKRDIRTRELTQFTGRYPLFKSIIIYVLRLSGLTFQEIGDIYGTSRQSAEQHYKKIKENTTE